MSNKALLAIDAGTLLTPEQKFSPGRLIIEGATVTEVGPPESVRVPPAVTRIDASRLLVTPGFIDPHIHGCGGVDVMDGTYESLNAISRIIRAVHHVNHRFIAARCAYSYRRATRSCDLKIL